MNTEPLIEIFDFLLIFWMIGMFCVNEPVTRHTPEAERKLSADRQARDIPMVSMGESILMHLPKLEEK